MTDTNETKKKKATAVRRTTIGSAISKFTGGHGVDAIERIGETLAAPSIESRAPVSVASNIIDTYEGQSVTHQIWAETTNRDFVARTLSRSLAIEGEPGSSSVLFEVARFFVDRSLAVVIADMVKVPMFKPSDTLFTKSDLYREVLSTTDNLAVAQAIMELVLPTLIEIGMVSKNGKFAAQDSYEFERVSVEHLSSEIAVIQAFAALDAIKISKIDRDNRQSKTVFAETVAEMFRPVGLALSQVPELTDVLSDVVKCVRANITPVGSVGSTAVAVSGVWASNVNIAELAQCLPFVRAALQLPADKEIRLVNDASTLENWVRLIVQMLRDTPRYRWISSAEALRHYGVEKVRMMTGEPVSLIAYRSVQVEPVAQTVIAVKDAVLGDRATFISATRDRVADTIQSAYGRAKFSTLESVDLISFVTSSLAEMGYRGWTGGVKIDAWGNGLTLSDIAVLHSDSVYVQFDDAGSVMFNDDTGQSDPVWWFKVATDERQLKVESGRHLGSEILTCDPVEALLAARDFTAKDVMPARRQLLSPAAFNATVTKLDTAEMLQPLASRFGFQIDVAGQKVSGAMRTRDFASLRSLQLASVVKPFYNDKVIRANEEAYMVALQMVQSASASDDSQWTGGVKPDAQLLTMIAQKCIVKLLQLAQQLSPTFRAEVQEAITDRVLSSEFATGEKAQMLRAKMVQAVYAAHCDLLALQFFLFVQGIETADWQALMTEPAMAEACALFGSDREPMKLA